MTYLRGNYMEKAAKEVLKESGFIVRENVHSTPRSAIDMVASCGGSHLLLEFKMGPVSTLDVSTFDASIADLKLPGEKKAFIFTDSVSSGSAASLSAKLKISILKITPEDFLTTVKQVIEEASRGSVPCGK